MIEINLIPDVKQELLRAQRARTVVISIAIVASIIAAGIVTLLAVWVFAVQTVRQTVADGDIKKAYSQLQSNNDLSKVLTVQNQLTKITDLNNAKHIDSRVFDVLAAMLPAAPNNVEISDFGVDSTTDTITIQAQASNLYQALEVFKKTVAGATYTYNDGTGTKTETLATNISTADVSYGEDSNGQKVLRFTLSFTYPDSLFSPLSTNLKLIPANQANATDSFLGLPQSVFSDRATDSTGGSN
jgi:hypothetical protein